MTRAKQRNQFRQAARLLAATALAVALLSGCSSVKNLLDGRGKDHSKDPTPLVQITPSVTVNKLWGASLGKGEEHLGVAQRPAIADGRVYAAGAGTPGIMRAEGGGTARLAKGFRGGGVDAVGRAHDQFLALLIPEQDDRLPGVHQFT